MERMALIEDVDSLPNKINLLLSKIYLLRNSCLHSCNYQYNVINVVRKRFTIGSGYTVTAVNTNRNNEVGEREWQRLY